MKLDYLFQRRSDPVREEPSLDAPGRSLVAFGRGKPSLKDDTELEGEDEFFSSGTYWDPPAERFSVTYDPEIMSPRQFSDWAHEMYICRKLTWDEYRVVGFPAELHPDYNRTVAALTGTRAAPDRPRNMVQEWSERLAFVRRHNDAETVEVKRTGKVLSLLQRNEPAKAS